MGLLGLISEAAEQAAEKDFVTQLTEVNNAINNFAWEKLGLVLLIGAGIILTICTKFFQVSHI